MLFASLMGRKFAIVVPRPGQIPVEEDLLALYRMRSLAIDHMPIRSLRNLLSAGVKRQPDEVEMEAAIEDFVNVSRTCIEAGAEVIIPGCSMLSMALALTNVTQADDAVLVDPLTSAVKLAEAMVDLRQGGRPWISRSLLYKQPAEDERAVSGPFVFQIRG
jgi:Asp/Glu/hydantoin racemase